MSRKRKRKRKKRQRLKNGRRDATLMKSNEGIAVESLDRRREEERKRATDRASRKKKKKKSVFSGDEQTLAYHCFYALTWPRLL